MKKALDKCRQGWKTFENYSPEGYSKYVKDTYNEEYYNSYIRKKKEISSYEPSSSHKQSSYYEMSSSYQPSSSHQQSSYYTLFDKSNQHYLMTQ